jgi:N4-gp56 family major capsid protein
MNRYGDISYETQYALVGRLLAAFYPMCVCARFGQAEVQKSNSGLIRKWRRYDPIPPATAPVAEGMTPPGQKITCTDYSATLEEFIHIVELTDVIQDTHQDPILQERTDALGQANGQTVELVTISVLVGGTQAMYANAGSSNRATVNGPPANGDFLKILRALDNNLAQPISKIINAGSSIATQAVAGGFYAFTHTDVIADLEHITGFQKLTSYANPGMAVPGEFGALGRIRYIATPNFKPWVAAGLSGSTYLTNGAAGTGKCDVYPVIVFGKDCYATVKLNGYDSAEIFVLKPGQARGGDPAGQRGSVSSKLWYTSAILCQPHLVRYEVAVTANPNW